MNYELLLNMFAILGGAVSTYVAIRADLTRAIITAERAEKDATDAHRRLDSHIEHHQHP